MLLRKGMKGFKVKELQKLLFVLGYENYLLPWGADGMFGNATDKAVRKFQEDTSISVDGIVGNQTWGKIDEVLSKQTNKEKNYTHYKISSTEIVEVDPMELRISIQDKAANRVTLKNFVTSGYQWHKEDGETYALGILVSEGEVISNRQPHAYIPEQWLPAGTLIVYNDGSVELKELSNIDNEKDAWFAVSGCSILPEIKMTSAGFAGIFTDIARRTDRPVIGYNSKKNKIIIAVRPNSDIERGQLTLKNLGCDFGITLDAGGSTCLRVDDHDYFSTTRRLYSLITW